METDGVQSIDEAAAVGEQSAAPMPLRKPRMPDWRPLAKRIGAAVAAIAAIGAVLSGLTGYWSIYKVVVGEWLGAKPAAMSSAKDTPVSAPRLSIAVMPFDNLSGDPSQDYFGDGIIENLTTDLSVNIPNLLVIARAAAFSYKGQKIDPKQVGHELNVRFLLQGSVQRTDKNVRLNARLVDAESGEQLWADRFEGDTTNTLQLQDQITARISNSLRLALINVGARQAQKHRNPDAFDMVLRAQAALNDERRLGINPRKQTTDFYRRALAIEPDNTDALTGLALVLSEDLANSRFLPIASRPGPDQANATIAEVTGLLDKASQTTAALSDAHFARALLLDYNRKLDDSRRELELARSINPNNVVVIYRLALNAEISGEPEKALPFYDEFFLRTAGKVPAYRVILAEWGNTYLLLGRWDEAIAKYHEAQALRAEPFASGRLAVALVQSGKPEQARPEYEIFRKWWTSQYGPPTIKAFEEAGRLFSDAPRYLELRDATVYDGYRKLGVPEE